MSYTEVKPCRMCGRVKPINEWCICPVAEAARREDAAMMALGTHPATHIRTTDGLFVAIDTGLTALLHLRPDQLPVEQSADRVHWEPLITPEVKPVCPNCEEGCAKCECGK